MNGVPPYSLTKYSSYRCYGKAKIVLNLLIVVVMSTRRLANNNNTLLSLAELLVVVLCLKAVVACVDFTFEKSSMAFLGFILDVGSLQTDNLAFGW